MKIPFGFKLILDDDENIFTMRSKVFGGWIVIIDYRLDEKDDDSKTYFSSVFIPDPGHKWEIECTFYKQ